MAREALKRTLVLLDELFAPIILFVAIYFAALALFLASMQPTTPLGHQSTACAAAVIATLSCVAIRRGSESWLFTPPRRAMRDLFHGVVGAAAIVVVADLLIQLSSRYERSYVGAVSLEELFGLLVVAAAHEELLFRGYAFAKIERVSVALAIAITSLLFAALHASNPGMSSVAMANLLLGGVLLALLRVISGTIWLPFAFHWAWNAVSGSLLGHEVSGFVMQASLFRELDRGPVLLTGGTFGIEGSLFITLCTAAAVAIVMPLAKRRAGQPRLV